MRFGLLGSLEIWTDEGATADLGGTQPRIVLAMLLGAGGHIVPVDTLIAAIWGDRVPPSASGTLQSYVSRLRRALEPDRAPGRPARMLRWEPPGYRLDVDTDEVDYRRFEQLADAGRAEMAGGRPDAARDLLVEALALWRGPALHEFANEEWARGLAVRLEERRVGAIEDRIAAELALGHHAAVIGDLAELVGQHPLREMLWAQLALALYRSGRQADALRALDDMRNTLRDELGVDPSRPLRDLEAQILDQDPALDLARATGAGATVIAPPVTAPAPAPAPHDPGAAIVGRRDEILDMTSAFEEMLRGRARFAVIEGEPGIGKTRLLEELSRAAVDAGATVRWGHCHEGGAAPAFWPWLEVLRAIVDVSDAGHGLDEQLGLLLAPTGDVADAPGADRFRLFEAVARALEDAARHAPLGIVLDDIQWADPASLELLEFLAGRLAESRILIAASVRELERTDAVVSALAALTRRPGTRRLQLRGLDESDTAVLVERATGRAPAAAVVRAIHDRADGNPFFVGELARLVVADVAGSDEELVERAGVPAGVRDVVRRRLARLPDATREVLQAAAVVGREAELEPLRRVADRELERCLDDLEPAIASGLLIEVPDAPATFRFAHALVREVVLEEVATLRRARLHLRAADAIVDIGGDTDDNAEILAAHLWAAVSLGDRRRAAGALERAAAVAVRRLAYESAEPLLERALQLRHSSGDDPTDLEAEFHTIATLARVRRARYGYVATATTTPLERARELAERTGRFDLLDELLWEEWAAAATACELDVAGRLAAQMLEIGSASDDPRLQALGNSAWGIHSWHTGHMTEARAHIDRAAEHALSTDLTVTGGRALAEALLLSACFQIAVHEFIDGPGDGEEKSAALAELVADPYAQVAVHEFSAYTGMVAGDPGWAARAGRRALALDPTGEFLFFTSGSALFLAWAVDELGDNDEAIALYETHLPRYAGIGVRTQLVVHLAGYALALARAGRHDEADAQLLEAQRLLDTHGERAQEPFVLLLRAEIEVGRGAPLSEIDALFAQAIAVATEQGATALARRAESARARVASAGG